MVAEHAAQGRMEQVRAGVVAGRVEAYGFGHGQHHFLITGHGKRLRAGKAHHAHSPAGGGGDGDDGITHGGHPFWEEMG